MKTLKIALIGCGWVSANCHAPAQQEYAVGHENVILAACCDSDARRAEELRERFGYRNVYTSYLEMLEIEQPQAVFLNVPPPLTARLAVEILRRGYPLMTEKPPAMDSASLEQMISAAREGLVIHQVAFNRRCMPLVSALKERLGARRIHHIFGRMARVRRLDAQFATTAVHLIDAARYAAGQDYEQVDLAYQELPEAGPGVANYQLHGRFSQGTSVHLEILPLAGVNVEQLSVYCEDQTFVLDAFNAPQAPGRLRHFIEGRLAFDMDAQQLTSRSEAYVLDGFYHETAAFLDAVQAGVTLAHDFASCRQSIALIECLLERRPVYSTLR